MSIISSLIGFLLLIATSLQAQFDSAAYAVADSIQDTVVVDTLVSADSLIEHTNAIPGFIYKGEKPPEPKKEAPSYPETLAEDDPRNLEKVSSSAFQYDDRSLIFYVVILQLFLLTITRLIDSTIIERQLGRFFKSLLAKQEAQEEQGLAIVFLYINAFVSLAMFVYLVLDFREESVLIYSWYLPVLILILAVAIYLKRFIASVFGFIIEQQQLTSALLRITENSLVVLGILLMPFLLLCNFSDIVIGRYILLVLAVVAALIYLVSLLRGFRLAFYMGSVNVFHLISYICASEIFTVLLISKSIWIWAPLNL